MFRKPTNEPPPLDPPHRGRVAGVKVARVVVADDGSVRFAGLAAPSVRATFYDAESVAHCAVGGSHKVPGWDCTCGFHVAYDTTSLSVMYEDWDQPMFVLLDVEATGLIVEHEHGMRVESQRILGATFADRCAFCDRPMATLATTHTVPASGARFGAIDVAHVVPSCRTCAPLKTTGVEYSLADVAGRLGVEVSIRAAPVATTMSPAQSVDRPSTRTRRGKIAAALAAGAAVASAAVSAFAGAWLATAGFTLAAVATLVPRVGPPRRSTASWQTVAAVAAAISVLALFPVSQEQADHWLEDDLVAFDALPDDPFAAQLHLFSTLRRHETVLYGDPDGVAGAVGAVVIERHSALPRCAVVTFDPAPARIVTEANVLGQCLSVAESLFRAAPAQSARQQPASILDAPPPS